MVCGVGSLSLRTALAQESRVVKDARRAASWSGEMFELAARCVREGRSGRDIVGTRFEGRRCELAGGGCKWGTGGKYESAAGADVDTERTCGGCEKALGCGVKIFLSVCGTPNAVCVSSSSSVLDVFKISSLELPNILSLSLSLSSYSS